MKMTEENVPDAFLFLKGQCCADGARIHHYGVIEKKPACSALA
jgi:hypothetical protein